MRWLNDLNISYFYACYKDNRKRMSKFCWYDLTCSFSNETRWLGFEVHMMEQLGSRRPIRYSLFGEKNSEERERKVPSPHPARPEACSQANIAWQDVQDLDCKYRKGMLVPCTSIPNRPSPKSCWLFFLQRPVRRLIYYYVKNDVNTLKTNQKMPVGKCDIITFNFFFFFSRIEVNADWIWSVLFEYRLSKH